MGFFDSVASLGRRLIGRRARAELEGPPLGQVLKSNFLGISSGPWQRHVKAEWLGPYTPTDVRIWVHKLMRQDPQLKLGLSARRAPFFGITYRLRGGNPRTRAFVQEAIIDGPQWDTLLRSILNALDFGYQSHELVWGIGPVDLKVGVGKNAKVFERLEQANVIQKFVDLDPERITDGRVDEYGDLVELVVDGMQSLPCGPDSAKALHVVHEGEWQNWQGKSDLNPAYNPWYWCNFLYLYLMRYGETRINPAMIARAPFEYRIDENATRDSKKPRNAMEVVAEAALELRNGSVGSLPAEWDDKTGNPKFSIDLLRDEGRVEQFVLAINHMQALKLRAILIPERIATQDTETGSFALVKEHVDIFLQVLEGVKQQTVIPALNRVAELLVRWNFGPSAPVPIFEGSELARQKHALLFELVKASLNVPLTLEDGRTYTAAQLIDFSNALESFNAPIHSPEEVATKPEAEPTQPGGLGRATASLELATAQKCWVFLRLPVDLAVQFPAKDEDDSPPHATILFVGDLTRDRFFELVGVVRATLSAFPSFPVELTDYGEFTNDEGQTIAHMIPRASELEVIHGALRGACERAGLVVAHHAGAFKPHVTLGYFGPGQSYEGPRPSGTWIAAALEVWGFDRVAVPLTAPA